MRPQPERMFLADVVEHFQINPVIITDALILVEGVYGDPAAILGAVWIVADWAKGAGYISNPLKKLLL